MSKVAIIHTPINTGKKTRYHCAVDLDISNKIHVPEKVTVLSFDFSGLSWWTSLITICFGMLTTFMPTNSQQYLEACMINMHLIYLYSKYNTI